MFWTTWCSCLQSAPHTLPHTHHAWRKHSRSFSFFSLLYFCLFSVWQTWYKTNLTGSFIYINPSFPTCPSCISPQVLKESGPPHMKSFLTRVTVGEFSAEGEGNSKKLSKKRAALSILQDLKKLPFIPAVEKPKTHYKKRTKTILKVLQLVWEKLWFQSVNSNSHVMQNIFDALKTFFFVFCEVNSESGATGLS